MLFMAIPSGIGMGIGAQGLSKLCLRILGNAEEGKRGHVKAQYEEIGEDRFIFPKKGLDK